MAGHVRSNSSTRRCSRLTCLNKRNSRVKDCSGVEHVRFLDSCTKFMLSAHEWNRKAKEEINLQKDVQVYVQSLEHVRDFNSNVVLLMSSQRVTRYEVTRRQLGVEIDTWSVAVGFATQDNR
ncbi:hypothetical protein YC2023_023500 [Brassica napus]